MVNRTKVLIMSLILIIVVLAGILIFTLVVKPAISGYAVDFRAEGFEIAIVSIMQRASQCEIVPLIYGNQTLDLVWVECLQQVQKQNASGLT